MRQTARDPDNRFTLAALAHLEAAKDARRRYHALIRASIETFGDRHQPTHPGRYCGICQANMLHQPEDMLNHQTGAAISGIYADHFPKHRKDALRSYARLIGEQVGLAFICWKRAGRRIDTLRPFLRVVYQIPLE